MVFTFLNEKKKKYFLNQVLNSQEVNNNERTLVTTGEKGTSGNASEVPLPSAPTYFVMIACYPFGPSKVFNCDHTHLHSR